MPDHIGDYNFKVEIDGLLTASVTKIEGLTGTEAFSGRAGQSGRVTLHGLIPLDGLGAQRLQSWHKASQFGARAQKRVSIVKYDKLGRVLETNLFEAWPSKWKGFSLDGKGTDTNVDEARRKMPGMGVQGASPGVSTSGWKMASFDSKSSSIDATVHGWNPATKKAIIGEVEMVYTGLRLK